MSKRISIIIVVIVTFFVVAALALAAEPLKGKVTKIEGDKITVTVEGAIPAWVKEGGNVTAGGGAPKVLSIQGNEITLRFSRAKAARIKPDTNLIMREFTGDELQGC